MSSQRTLYCHFWTPARAAGASAGGSALVTACAPRTGPPRGWSAVGLALKPDARYRDSQPCLPSTGSESLPS